MKTLRITGLFIVCCVAIQVSWIYGPISKLPGIIRVNESYIEVLYQQYLFVGLVTSMVVCAFAKLFKINLVATAVVLFVSGIVFSSLTQLEDPDAINYLFSAVLEFIVPYMGVSLCVMGLFYGANRF